MGSINGFGKDLQWGVDDGVGFAIISGLCLRKPKRVFTFLKTELVVCDYFERTTGHSVTLPGFGFMGLQRQEKYFTM